ncbi:MAG: polysaccharide biosynthesis/export family protein [Bryobacterales bacterium]|nr:polysaccharide biosynthesis/export family protein [Bryobacterales bacterium]
MKTRYREFWALMLVMLTAMPTLAQQPAQQPGAAQPQSVQQLPLDSSMERARLTYVLGANDQIGIRVPQAEDIHEKVFRVDPEGNVYFPMLGNVKLGGLTVEQAEAELTRQLKKFYQNPLVSITVTQYRSDPIFLLGAFRSPGIYPLVGRRTLMELISSVGGPAPNASRRIKITRRLDQGRIPLPNATEDSARNVSVAEVNIARLLENPNASEDLVLKPYDILRVGIEEMVYVSGEAGKSGAFPLNDKESISIVQLLAISGGLGPNAAPEKAKILRPVLDTARRAEIPVDLRAVMSGRANDMPLLPNDVLVIPAKSGRKQAVGRTAWVLIPGLATTLIWVALR